MYAHLQASSQTTVKAVRAAELQRRRARLIVQIGGATLVLSGLGWGVFFAWHGGWHVVVADLIMVTVGGSVLVFAARGQTRTGAVLMYGAMFVLLCVSATWKDVPTAAAPRSVHTYFLTLAVSAFLVFQEEARWLRLWVTLGNAGAYLVFGSTNAGVVSEFATPEAIRVVGTWVNNAVAIALVFLIIGVMRTDLRWRDGLEAEFVQAIQRGELELFYQPQADADGNVIGAEALMRWRHPVRGLVPPDAFIPMAEESGLIVPAGQWAIKAACLQLKAWAQQPGLAHLTMSVNVSAAQFQRSDFVPSVLDIIAHTEVPAGHLKLELTESMLIDDVDSIIDKMRALKARGLGFSLDDFGTGFSSLSYLKRLPLDQLKIDQAFVRDVMTDPNDAAIAHTIIDLGRNLGLQVIAEGVEGEGQKRFLLDNGCKSFQGYLIGRPVPAKMFEALASQSPPLALAA